MPEPFDEYRQRVLGYLGDRDPLRVQRSTPRVVGKLVDGLPKRILRWRPAPKQWSILEVLGHMADAELAMAWRLRSMLASPGVPLAWFDQDEWARKLAYNEGNVKEYLALFGQLRKSNLQLLRAFTPRQQRAGYGIHSVRGRQTVAEFVQLEAAHDLSHLRQIRAILKARA